MKLARRFACPACGTSITFQQLIGTDRFAFPCRQCGARLHKRLRASFVWLVSLFLLISVGNTLGIALGIGIAILGTLLVTALVGSIAGRVSLAPAGMIDADLAGKLGLDRTDGRSGANYSDLGGDSDGGD